MQKEKNISTQEVISMEEYLNKRQKIREQEKKRFGGRFGEEKSPAWMMATDAFRSPNDLDLSINANTRVLTYIRNRRIAQIRAAKRLNFFITTTFVLYFISII